MPIDLICLDADDTLWRHESYFQDAARRYHALLVPFADPAHTEARLVEAEERNLHLYGYGVKGFTLSMIETALDIAGDALPAGAVAQILAIGRELMRHPIEPLPGVRETLPKLAARARLVLVTKGDLFHQESKLAASGLGDQFAGVEIVSEKTAATYTKIFARYGAAPHRAVMVGNSLRSDILPALAAGAFALHIPHEFEWARERAEPPLDEPRFAALESFADLSGWLGRVD
ncbi:MAG: HAD family hydrolase [Pseudomonadota bacterium]|nr:HAD family hydrolase [Pseudomonadota bacterium]